MNKNSKKVRIMAIVLAIFLALTFLLPAFSMLAGAEQLPESTPTAAPTFLRVAICEELWYNL